jgi:hypothetical protein
MTTLPSKCRAQICVGGDEARDLLTVVGNSDAGDTRVPTVWRWQ